MGNSLRDQLLKQGLVSKEQAKNADKEAKSKTHQQQKQKRKSKKASKKKQEQTTETVDTTSAAYLATKAREEEIARAKELNRQKEVERQQKAIQAQIRDLIQGHNVNDPKADIPYNFTDDKYVKQILITAKQQQQLTYGFLAITVLDEAFYLVPSSIAEKLLERAPEIVVSFNKAEKKIDKEEDDPYADYQVPDDLMW